MFKKLLLSFLTIILVLVSVLTVFVARYSQDILNRDILEAYNKSAENVSNQCDTYIVQIQNVLLSLSVEPEIQSQMRHFRPDTGMQPAKATHMRQSFDYQVFPIHNGEVYFPAGENLYHADEVRAKEDWLLHTLDRGGRLSISTVNEGQTRFIRFSMLVTDTDDWQTRLGILAIDVQLDVFMLSIGKSTLDSQDYIFLVDDRQQIQYPYQTTLISADSVSSVIAEKQLVQDEHILLSYPMIRSSWHLILSFSTAGMQVRSHAMYKTIAGIAVVAILLACLFSLFLSYWHTQPIIRLANQMKGGTLQPISDMQGLNQDYRTLYASYNDMVAQIGSLLSELYETNRREQEAQLKMLQSQLNPHFIYNVLDSVNWLAMKYKAKDIQMMVGSLATMLRCSLNSGRNILSVAQEIRQIQSYLNIQSYRYDNSIQVSYDFAPEIMDKRMIKLLLQSIVENAIIHGLETYDGEKHLRLSGRLQDDLLVFEVSNNGIQPDLNRIRQILDGNQQVTTSYGIRSVNERIRSAYGSQYCLRYELRDGWTVANITIPSESHLN